MVFQTRQLTASAGDDLVHPARHGLPPSTETVDIPVTRAGAGGWVRAWWMLPVQDKVPQLREVPLTALMLVLQGFTVLYLHGVSSSRAYCHRLGLYRLLLGGSQLELQTVHRFSHSRCGPSPG